MADVIGLTVGRADVPSALLGEGVVSNGERSGIVAHGTLGRLSIGAVLLPGENGSDSQFLAGMITAGVDTETDDQAQGIVGFAEEARKQFDDGHDVMVPLDGNDGAGTVFAATIETLRPAMEHAATGSPSQI